MSIQSAPFYWLECDETGCGIKSTEESEHAAWSEEAHAVEEASNSDWFLENGKHLCPEPRRRDLPTLRHDRQRLDPQTPQRTPAQDILSRR